MAAVDSVAAVGSSVPANYSVAVTKKQQDQTKAVGQESLQLIQSAAPELATSGSVGTKLNFVA
jgi:hypothetical protein